MLRIIVGIVIAIALFIFGFLQWREEPKPEFTTLTTLTVDGNAEIIQASGDGKLLVFTNPKQQSVGVVDLTDPSNPKVLGNIGVPGEPTSVDLSTDGRWALATVHVTPAEEGDPPADLRLPGVLTVIDLQDPANGQLVSVIGIGNQPDSIAVTEAGEDLVAVIAIENEPVFVADNVVVDEDAPGDALDISPPGVVQIVTLNPATPRNWSVATLAIPSDLLTNKLMHHSDDPQPEYVALSPGRHLAAVSLQENNGLILVDLTTPAIADGFSLGDVADRLADLTSDDNVDLAQIYPADVATQAGAGSRTPDAIVFTPDGQHLITANEGEADMTGGRGISIWSLTGELVWDDNGDIEQRAAAAGLYPDERSDKKGVEIEGIATGQFGTRDFAFAVSERGSFLIIYDISNPHAPEFVDILPTGEEPESVIALPSRNLVIVAAEESGSLSIFRYESDDATGDAVGNPAPPAEEIAQED